MGNIFKNNCLFRKNYCNNCDNLIKKEFKCYYCKSLFCKFCIYFRFDKLYVISCKKCMK